MSKLTIRITDEEAEELVETGEVSTPCIGTDGVEEVEIIT